MFRRDENGGFQAESEHLLGVNHACVVMCNQDADESGGCPGASSDGCTGTPPGRCSNGCTESGGRCDCSEFLAARSGAASPADELRADGNLLAVDQCHIRELNPQPGGATYVMFFDRDNTSAERLARFSYYNAINNNGLSQRRSKCIARLVCVR
jgi:hypothetical protein